MKYAMFGEAFTITSFEAISNDFFFIKLLLPEQVSILCQTACFL